jgi:S-(hydroxymethyl)glutathione dehydrogenase / alcohol dehydrogenase
MKAAILQELKQPLVIADIDLPAELKYGQVHVKVICSGICGSQLGEIDGNKGPDKYLPHLLGHEGGGVVLEAGPGVTRVKKGDHVVMHWRKGAGIESPTPKYKWGNESVNSGWVTTFNEQAVVSENRLTPISGDIDLELAALMGCAITTAFGVINNDVKLKFGESIAVFGVGSVGLNVVQAASLMAANPIIAVDIHDNKLEAAKKYGATHTINALKSDIKQEIMSIVGKNGVDAAVDITGNVKIIETAYELTSSTGRTVLVGVPKAGEKISIYTLPLHFEKELFGSHGGESNPSVDIPRYLNVYDKGRLEYKSMITRRYGLDEINTAIDDMRAGKGIKCMIRMDD